jgi:hypothetical protein
MIYKLDKKTNNDLQIKTKNKQWSTNWAKKQTMIYKLDKKTNNDLQIRQKNKQWSTN